jgi:hypothetical protein
VRLTPRVVAIAAIVYCPDPYISCATWSLWAVITDGRVAGAGGGQSRVGALADQLASELGQGGDFHVDIVAQLPRRWCPGPG